MLLLVMSANFALLLAGWGLVGLSSYLLIGFWHERKAPVDAAKKAFVMNAIGDVGIAIAIFFLVRDLGTVQFQGVFDQAGARWPQGSATANWIAFRCSSEPSRSRPRSRSRHGFPTPWRARRRCRR